RRSEVHQLRSLPPVPSFRNEEKSLALVGVVMARYVNGPAHRKSENILLERRHAVVEKIARVDNIVAPDLVAIAMKSVAAGLGYDVDHAISVAAGVRRIVARLDLHLLQRIHRREQVEPAIAARIHGQNSVVSEFGG